jgi:hypothetical protein
MRRLWEVIGCGILRSGTLTTSLKSLIFGNFTILIAEGEGAGPLSLRCERAIQITNRPSTY